jgi:hypothetical protein
LAALTVICAGRGRQFELVFTDLEREAFDDIAVFGDQVTSVVASCGRDKIFSIARQHDPRREHRLVKGRRWRHQRGWRRLAFGSTSRE